MPRVVHFEIHAENPQRAMQFYMRVFGWKFKKWDGHADYWTIQTVPPSAPGINGGMIRRKGPQGLGFQTFVCTIDVPNIEDYIGKVIMHDGLIVVPKAPIPGIGWIAYAKDTEGNIFSIMQEDHTAK